MLSKVSFFLGFMQFVLRIKKFLSHKEVQRYENWFFLAFWLVAIFYLSSKPLAGVRLPGGMPLITNLLSETVTGFFMAEYFDDKYIYDRGINGRFTTTGKF